jgi:H+/Cl- antiporter ClcA
MWAKRVKELIASWLVGHGVLLLIAPRQRALLWLFGRPERLRRLTRWYANHPTVMRLRGIAAIGSGIWLALRQYRETARPWYQRWSSQYRLIAGPWLAPLGFLALLLAALAVIYRRSSRGEGSTVEEQAREEMRTIIRESVERSRQHQR